MDAEFLRRFAVGGGARPDALTGLNPQFAGSIAQMFAAAPQTVQDQLRISSAYRSPQRQSEILSDSLAKRVGGDAVAQWRNYVTQAGGDVVAAGEAARPWLRSLGITKWVAPPGSSNHQKGVAVDLQYLDPAARQWMHANAPQYGLNFPMSNEDWHLEPANVRSMTLPAAAGGPAPGAPAMQPGTAVPMMAQAGAPQPVTPGFQMAPVMPSPVSPLAAMFATQQADAEAKKAEAEKQAADQRRRAALFSGPSPFG